MPYIECNCIVCLKQRMQNLPKDFDTVRIQRKENNPKPLQVTKQTKVYTILSWYLPADTAKTACKQIMEVLV